MVYCVGLTGDIASGKSTVAGFFIQWNIEVIQADVIALALTQLGSPAYKKIVEHFGDTVLLPNKELNRRQMRDIIFSRQTERRWLESLLHPLIYLAIEKQLQLCKSSYAVVEIPLLTTKDRYPFIDRILLITTDSNLQLQRIMERDNCNKEQALALIASQPHPQERLQFADDVLNNNKGLENLYQKAELLHHFYLELR